jgi:hypothetical protein
MCEARAQKRRPIDLTCALVELPQMLRGERREAGQDAAGAAQFQVRAPDVVPAALQGYAALDQCRFAEADGARLGAQLGLEAGKGGEEDLKGIGRRCGRGGHRAGLV